MISDLEILGKRTSLGLNKYKTANKIVSHTKSSIITSTVATSPKAQHNNGS